MKSLEHQLRLAYVAPLYTILSVRMWLMQPSCGNGMFYFDLTAKYNHPDKGADMDMHMVDI